MKIRRFVALCLTVLLLLLCAGCASLIQAFENEEVRSYTETMLNAILTDDQQSAYTLIEAVSSEASFGAAFSEMQALLEGVEDYELQLYSINQNRTVTNGETVSSISAVYQMTAETGTYMIIVQTSDPYPFLASFEITPIERTNYYCTGLLRNMKDARPMQWAMLLSNILILGIMVFAFVDCLRHRVKRKVLWLLLIALGVVTVGATMYALNFRFNFNLGWLTAYTAYIRYGGGKITLRFMLPLGAVAYFVARHWIIQRPTPELPVQNEIAPGPEDE